MCVQLEKKVTTISAKNVKMLEKNYCTMKQTKQEQSKNCSSKKGNF